ncbi:MAG: aliphatic sulfonate ABC transporter substrate-binding protein [Mycobacteriaceae bacterium]
MTTARTRSLLLRAAALTAAVGLLAGCVSGESSTGAVQPAASTTSAKTLNLDYAYYNPESLVIKDQGWLEQALPKTKVTWVLSAGSNKANENLRAGVVDFGSTAGTPALLARANGSPQKVVDVYSQPEWSAIVVAKGSPITDVAQLKGRKIAATLGTDPYFFLLQTLATAGLSPSDVQIVNLQHADGKTALERGDVDAWAGLDPFMAQTELESGSALIYRNLAFNSYGLLNANESFLAQRPQDAQTVIDTYERARAWIKANPDKTAQILATAAKIQPAVAQRQLGERTRLDINPVPGAAQTAVLTKILPLLVKGGLVRSADEARTALDSLYAPTFAEKAAGTPATGR